MTADRIMAASGNLIGIARRPRSRAPMEEIETALVSTKTGLEGDCKGAKFPRRQITILAREDWEAACEALVPAATLTWTVRRANLLVEGVRLPRAKGARMWVGPVELEVTAETYPCRQMEKAHAGLLKALGRDWRGGVTCRVVRGGRIGLGDPVGAEPADDELPLPLPG